MAEIQITAEGTGFQDGSIMTLNGVAVSTQFINSTELQFPIETNNYDIGPVNVTVRNSDLQESNTLIFTVEAAPPNISSVDPNEVAQNTAFVNILLTGTGFVDGCVALLGSVPTEVSTVFTDSTQVAFDLTPSDWAVGPLNIQVRNPDNEISNTVQITLT